MSAMKCIKGYMVTLKFSIINICLDKNGQLRKKMKTSFLQNER